MITNSPNSPPVNGPRPYWVPSSVAWETLSTEAQRAIQTLISPLYRDLVLGEVDALSKAVGATIVHLVWLEVFDQIRLGEDPAAAAADSTSASDRQAVIAAHLRLVGAKAKMINLHLRMSEFRQRWGAGHFGLPDAPPPEPVAEMPTSPPPTVADSGNS
jgi:hypothetical protein